jgi:AmmeMemoRadiSam system protein A
MTPSPPRLDPGARRELLDLARRTLEAHLAGRELPRREPDNPLLREPRGAFVSLHRGTELRGCIGSILPAEPLHETIRRCAVSAAEADPRFPPVRLAEIGDIEIEISVLSPLRRIDPVRVEVGTHGLVVSRSGNRGLLLPQVATEQGWDRETFLAHTCRKAGLAPNAWRDPGTSVEAFTAEVFSEHAP